MITTLREMGRQELTKIRKTGAIALAKEIATEAAWDSGEWDSYLAAEISAVLWLSDKHILTVYAYLRNAGFSFDMNRAKWSFHLLYSDDISSQ